MKDALTQRCLTDKQLGLFLSKRGTPRFNKIVCEHAEHCDECWAKLEPHVQKFERRKLEESEGALMALLFPDKRPVTRDDCKDAARPCPWLGCRHHLWSDEHDGVEARVLSLPVIGAPSCALDVVDEGKDLLPTEIGRMIQRRPEEVSENLESALRKCKEAGVFLRADAGSERTRNVGTDNRGR
jgi:hypothetical protein